MKWLLILFLFITAEKIYSQDQTFPVVVNPLIGDTLNPEERNYYNLFPTIDGFQWGVFYMNPDSSLSAKIAYTKDGHIRDTLFALSNTLDKIKQYIFDIESAKTVVNEDVAEVSAQLLDGGIISGNLLSVRQASILIYNSNRQTNDNEPDYNLIHNVKQRDIEQLTIMGQSHVLMGMGIGLLAGIGLGTLVGYAAYGGDSGQTFADIGRAREAAVTGLAVGLGIFALGTIIGIATSTPDKVITQFSDYDITGLSSYSKYPVKEPYELRKIE